MLGFRFAQHAEGNVELLFLFGEQLSFFFRAAASLFLRRHSRLDFFNALQLFGFSLAQHFDFSVETIRSFSLLLRLVFGELSCPSLFHEARLKLNDPFQKTLLGCARRFDFYRQ